MLPCLFIADLWSRADLLALVGDVYCIFVTLPCGILGQVWSFIVSFPDLCRLSYFFIWACCDTRRLVPHVDKAPLPLRI